MDRQDGQSPLPCLLGASPTSHDAGGQGVSGRAYTPAATADCVLQGRDLVCPDCAADFSQLYRRMGSPEPAVCGRCFDNRMFGDDAEARAAAEVHRDEALRWMYGPGGRAALQEVLGEVLGEAKP